MRQLFVFLVTVVIMFSCAKDKSSPKNLDNTTKDSNATPVKVEPENKNSIEEEIEASIIFTVQVAALHNPNSNYKSLQNADVYKEGNFTKYRIGHFETYKEAKSFRRKVLKTYPGAFIQALENDKPIHISKALQ
jgi:hypothetical protein